MLVGNAELGSPHEKLSVKSTSVKERVDTFLKVFVKAAELGAWVCSGWCSAFLALCLLGLVVVGESGWSELGFLIADNEIQSEPLGVTVLLKISWNFSEVWFLLLLLLTILRLFILTHWRSCIEKYPKVVKSWFLREFNLSAIVFDFPALVLEEVGEFSQVFLVLLFMLDLTFQKISKLREWLNFGGEREARSSSVEDHCFGDSGQNGGDGPDYSSEHNYNNDKMNVETM